ncbi:hypothetical protein C0J52_11991 [Blattella germanica]|nr:hypothetical protein C0J52_11991 [Blattella germanica]
MVCSPATHHMQCLIEHVHSNREDESRSRREVMVRTARRPSQATPCSKGSCPDTNNLKVNQRAITKL